MGCFVAGEPGRDSESPQQGGAERGRGGGREERQAGAEDKFPTLT